MADQPRTQKQISLTYKDNLDYLKHGHPFRRLKLFLFLLAVFGSIGAVFGVRYWGSKEFFNTGPISQNHARFINDCARCHDESEPDLSRALKLDQAITGLKENDLPTLDLEELRAMGSKAADGAKNLSVEELKLAAQRQLSPEKLSAVRKAIISKSSLAGMDAACLKCHDSLKLHQPQKEALSLRGVHPELPLVHATRCSSCHREHVGHGLMKFPGDETCASCHADASEMQRTRGSITVTDANPPTKPENRALKVVGQPNDRLIRFIMPQDPKAPPAIIKNYADGHPAFQYERSGARDPAEIKFNHQRHEQSDIKLAGGRQLVCTDCHQATSDGEFNNRISYDQHCSQCHGLGLVADLPGLKIPHGDTGKAISYIVTLNSMIVSELVKQNPGATPGELAEPRGRILENMKRRGITGDYALHELRKRVFYTGDPPAADGQELKGQIFPACVKCHTEADKSQRNATELTAVPTLLPTNMADRWIHHGPFTHLPHTHMKCDDCHGAVHQSRNTSDILLPKQQLCAECHRPLQRDKLMEISNDGVAAIPKTPAAAAHQRLVGGVKWECQNCHKFHADPEAIDILQTNKPTPVTAQK